MLRATLFDVKHSTMMVTAAALVSNAVARLVPRQLAERPSPGWAWAVPPVIASCCLLYERRWFV
jgi:hypothetical protein